MKVGILGSGGVGRTLGAGFAAHGYAVMLGTRDPADEKIAEWVQTTGMGVSAGTLAETAAFGELLVLAVNFDGAENALRLAGAGALAGKVLIDVTNPLRQTSTGPELTIGFDDSAGERVQRWAAGARVVKAWNIVTARTMVSPLREEGVPDMFIAGNDADAKAQATRILREFGWSVVDLGGIVESRLLEPLALVWMRYGFATGQWTHALKMLRK